MSESAQLDQQQVLEVYSGVLNAIWKKAVNMLGPVALATMIEAAVFEAASVYPFLDYITVSEEGVSLPEDLSGFDDVAAEELKSAFKLLFSKLFANVATLTGQVVVKHLRPELEEAEQKLNGD